MKTSIIVLLLTISAVAKSQIYYFKGNPNTPGITFQVIDYKYNGKSARSLQDFKITAPALPWLKDSVTAMFNRLKPAATTTIPVPYTVIDTVMISKLSNEIFLLRNSFDSLKKVVLRIDTSKIKLNSLDFIIDANNQVKIRR